MSLTSKRARTCRIAFSAKSAALFGRKREHPFDRIGQRLRIAGWNEPTGFPVQHGLAGRAERGRDDGNAHGLGFDRHPAETFRLLAGTQDQVGAGIGRDQVGLLDERDPVRRARDCA